MKSSISIPVLASLLFGAAVRGHPKSPPATQQLPYEFNAVAVTSGGFVTNIIAHPTEENLMYARTDIGSSYRWDVALNKWVPLTDFVSEANSNLLGTETLALDPTDPDRLYLAQGRYLTSTPSAFFVSSDRGQTFEIYDAPFPFGSNELGRNNGERMAVNPFKPNELYIGTRTEGLWKSEDRAKTWTNVTSIPNAYANTIGISFVIFDPHNEGHIYAGATAPEGLFYSTDSGTTWAAIPGQPSSWNNTYIFPNETAPQSTAPQPMKAALTSTGVLYVTYGDFPGPYGTDYGAVYKFNTKTEEWTDITPVKGNVYPPPYEPQAFPAGGYCGLSLDAKDPDTLVVVSLDRDPGPALDSMYVSRDAGNSWKDVTQLSTPNRASVDGYWGLDYSDAKLANGTAVPWLNFDWSQLWGGYGAPSPAGPPYVKFGWWMSATLMSPWDPNTIMHGTGATIWTSNDVLSSVENNCMPSWHIQAQGIEMTATLAMISPSKGPSLFSGFGDINGFRHTSLDVPQPMFGLPVFSNLNSIDWAGQNVDVIIRAGANGLVNNASTGCHQAAYSTDNGVEWNTFANCIPGVNSSSSGSGTIAVDASGKYVIWSRTETALQGSSNTVTSDSGPYYSSNFGKTWSSPTGLTLQTYNISSDKVRPGTFYSFTNNTWYVSTNGGASYTSYAATSVGLPSDATGAVPVAHFAAAGHVYLSLGTAGVYYTTNYGRSWKRITASGEVVPQIFSIGAGKPGSGCPSLYIWGTTRADGPVGLYRSDDNGATWARVNDAAHQYGGPALIQGDSQVYGRVYLGTEGRGIVYAQLVHGGKAGQANLPGTGGI